MQNTKTKHLGAITFWSLSSSDVAQLRSNLKDLRLDSHVPEQSRPMVALRSAMEEVYPKKLIRRTRSRGFVAVNEIRGDDENTYESEASANVDENGELVIGPNMSTYDAELLRDSYNTFRSTLPPSSTSAMLSKLVVESIGGTTLRPAGGIYWLPGDRIAEWKRIAAAVESAAKVVGKESPSSVFVVQHELNEDSVRAVRDAILSEARQESERIRAELAKAPGERATENRIREAMQLRDKMARYEQILSLGAQTLAEGIVEVETEGAAAAFDQMTSELEPANV